MFAIDLFSFSSGDFHPNVLLLLAGKQSLNLPSVICFVHSWLLEQNNNHLLFSRNLAFPLMYFLTIAQYSCMIKSSLNYKYSILKDIQNAHHILTSATKMWNPIICVLWQKTSSQEHRRTFVFHCQVVGDRA